MAFPELTFSEFARRYCDRQDSTPETLLDVLRAQVAKYSPLGFFMGEAQLFDSSWFGSLTVLPFGPNNSFKIPPETPFSPRGLASDTSVVVGILPVASLPETLPEDLKDWKPPSPPEKKGKKAKAKG